MQGVASLDQGGARDLGFLRSAAFADALAGSAVGAVIAPDEVDVGDRPVIRSSHPNLDFARASALLCPPARPAPGVAEGAHVAADAVLAPSVCVGPGAVVAAGAVIGPDTVIGAGAVLGEGVAVGRDCWIHPRVVVRERCVIGDRVHLQPGVVIGGDGFGYEFNERGEHEKVPQVGNVVIEDDVEIGANTTVDRARLGTTRIRRGAKIDNLVQIAHNVEIGEHAIVVAQAGIAGSTRLGDRVIMMAQSGAAGHLEIGAGSFLAARAGVFEDVEPGSRLWGFPARAERAWHRSASLVAKLPEIARRLRAVEKKVGLRGGEDS